jgi:hypothetical protein
MLSHVSALLGLTPASFSETILRFRSKNYKVDCGFKNTENRYSPVGAAFQPRHYYSNDLKDLPFTVYDLTSLLLDE